MADNNLRKCSLCNKSTAINEINSLFFGEWMTKNEIQVHYYCLLLSTNLPQKGEDFSGILGFLIRDIRTEITKAKKRKCKYCHQRSATIMCSTCNEYFHLTCGHTNRCRFQMVDEFKSYCFKCTPADEVQMRIVEKIPPELSLRCYICMHEMGVYNRARWIYAKCCMNGYAHNFCMKQYALSAGYYLTCIWCKNKSFRNDIKYQGVFVPDRDANWEKEKGAYQDLYCSQRRCDMEKCNCPKGRDFINSGKWTVIKCKFCGAFGAHNPSCIPGFESSKEKLSEFKCDVCSVTEQTIYLDKTTLEEGNSPSIINDLINTSLYIHKEPPHLTHNLGASMDFSDDSLSSVETVVNCKTLQYNPISTTENHISNSHMPPTLTQSQNEETLQKDLSQRVIVSSIYTLSEGAEEIMCDQVIEGDATVNQVLDKMIVDEETDSIAAAVIDDKDNTLSENSKEMMCGEQVKNKVIEDEQQIDSAAAVVSHDEEESIEYKNLSDEEKAAMELLIKRMLDMFE